MIRKVVAELLLAQHARRYEREPPYPEYLQIVSARDQVFERFQRELHKPESLQESTFRDFLAFEHNQHWTGLHRPSKHACDDMPRLRHAIAYLFDEDIAIAKRLDRLTTDETLLVPGVSFGILTPLLLIRYPNKYGVWNGKSEAALKALNIWPSFERGTSRGERYALLNDLFLQYSARLGLDLWCLDGLWHVVNEWSKRDTDEAFRQSELEEREYLEGKRVLETGIRIERNTKARNECVKLQGLDCAVCGFNFFRFYGEVGLNYIHVHHVEDLKHSKENQSVDPGKDLVPVCPNCHAMLHKGVETARSVEQLKEVIQRAAEGR